MIKGVKYSVLVFILTGIVLVGVVGYFSTTTSMSITCTGCKSIDIYTKSDYDAYKLDKPVISLSGSNLKTRVFKGEYTALYKGGSDYSDQEKNISIKEPVVQKIKLQYSDSKLDTILNNEIISLHKIISLSNPDIDNLYTINRGKLYGMGEWYATTLVYKGSDLNNADTLRVVLHKNNDQWNIITKFPSIVIQRHTYPTIPEYVVKDINDYQQPDTIFN